MKTSTPDSTATPRTRQQPPATPEAENVTPQDADFEGAERRSQYDRRRGPGRRRTDFRKAAEEGHMNEEQLEFIRAVDEYKRVNHRPFPTLTEVLDVLLYLGYRRVAPIGEFKLTKARDAAQADDGSDTLD